MMDIILKRNVKTKSFRLFMDVRKSGKRDDIVAILMLADENGGEIYPADVCTHLIDNRPTTVGERIIQRCAELGVLEVKDNFKGLLTDDGRRAVENKTVYIPESGLYQILYSDEILLPSPLLDCIPDEKKSEKDDNTEEIDPVIRSRLENKYFKLLGKAKSEIFVEKIKLNGREIRKKSTLNLTYSLLENGNILLRLNGDIDTKLEPPKFTQMEIWDLLVESMYLGDDWDVVAQCLRRSFEELRPKELLNFMVELRTNELIIEEMGTFSDVTVKNVPIIPKTTEDAYRWALWLLKNSINDYLKSHEYENIVQNILLKFTGYEIKLPTQIELAKMIREETEDKLPASYWYLKAPIDIAGVM